MELKINSKEIREKAERILKKSSIMALREINVVEKLIKIEDNEFDTEYAEKNFRIH